MLVTGATVIHMNKLHALAHHALELPHNYNQKVLFDESSISPVTEQVPDGVNEQYPPVAPFTNMVQL